MDGRYAGNAGAIAGVWPWMVGIAENAGAISDRQGWRECRKCRSYFWPAMAVDGRYAGPSVLPAPAGTSHFLWVENAGTIPGSVDLERLQPDRHDQRDRTEHAGADAAVNGAVVADA